MSLQFLQNVFVVFFHSTFQELKLNLILILELMWKILAKQHVIESPHRMHVITSSKWKLSDLMEIFHIDSDFSVECAQ